MASLLEGHEECEHDIDIIESWQGNSWKLVHCGHEHDEPIKADDGLDTGPIVAYYCNCCGRFERTEEYK